MRISLDPPPPVNELDTTTMTIDELLDSGWFYYVKQLTVQQAKQSGVNHLLARYHQANNVYREAHLIQQMILCCQEMASKA